MFPLKVVGNQSSRLSSVPIISVNNSAILRMTPSKAGENDFEFLVWEKAYNTSVLQQVRWMIATGNDL